MRRPFAQRFSNLSDILHLRVWPLGRRFEGCQKTSVKIGVDFNGQYRYTGRKWRNFIESKIINREFKIFFNQSLYVSNLSTRLIFDFRKLKILKIFTNSNRQGLHFSFFFILFIPRYVHDFDYYDSSVAEKIVAAILAIRFRRIAHVRHPWRLSFERHRFVFDAFLPFHRSRKNSKVEGHHKWGQKHARASFSNALTRTSYM